MFRTCLCGTSLYSFFRWILASVRMEEKLSISDMLQICNPNSFLSKIINLSTTKLFLRFNEHGWDQRLPALSIPSLLS